MIPWDIFISHASEDKDVVKAPIIWFLLMIVTLPVIFVVIRRKRRWGGGR